MSNNCQTSEQSVQDVTEISGGSDPFGIVQILVWTLALMFLFLFF